MKLNKIMLAGILLLAIITIGAVSAAEHTNAQANDSLAEESEITLEEDIDTPVSEGEKQDPEITISYPDEVVRKDYDYPPVVILNVPNDYRYNQYSVYVDGKFEKDMYRNQDEAGEHGINVNRLNLGNHILTVHLPENDNYTAVNVSKTFKVIESRIDIPDEVIVGQHDTVTITVSNEATGYLTVKVDGVQIAKNKLESNAYDSYASVSLSGLKMGTHEIEATYSGDKAFKKNVVKKKINVTFEIEYYRTSQIYGDNQIHLRLPVDVKKTPTVTINGIQFKANETIKERHLTEFIFNTGRAPIGENNITVTYPGDSKYPKRTITKTDSTYPEIQFEYKPSYNDTLVCLRLPEDAKGELIVYINGEFYKSQPVVNGEANVLADLPANKYLVFANYTSDDYLVYDNTIISEISPKFIYKEKLTYGENQTLFIEVDPKVKCNLSIISTGENWTALDIVNGKANATLKTEGFPLYITSGKDFSIRYEDERGFSSKYTVKVYVQKIPSKITNAKDVTMYYGDIGTFQATIWGDYGLPVGEMGKFGEDSLCKFYIASQEYRADIINGGVTKIRIGSEVEYLQVIKKSNGYRYVKLKLPPGTYKLKIAYHGSSVTKKIVIKQPLSLKTAKVKKSAKKLVLEATLKKGKTPIKNKQITFKFNGKTYKAKTDKKGIAKVTVKSSVLKKLKVGKKITYQATYIQDTVKKTVKVQK